LNLTLVQNGNTVNGSGTTLLGPISCLTGSLTPSFRGSEMFTATLSPPNKIHVVRGVDPGGPVTTLDGTYAARTIDVTSTYASPGGIRLDMTWSLVKN
jgi:hypothetical protein